MAPVLGAIGNKSAVGRHGPDLHGDRDRRGPAGEHAHLLACSVRRRVPRSTRSTGAFSWTPTDRRGTHAQFTVRRDRQRDAAPHRRGGDHDQRERRSTRRRCVGRDRQTRTVDEETAAELHGHRDRSGRCPARRSPLDAGAPTGAAINGARRLHLDADRGAGTGRLYRSRSVSRQRHPRRFGETIITVTVNEVNSAPVLAAIGNKTVRRGHGC